MTARGVIATVLVFAVALGCARLGFWQLDRLQQRRQRNDEVRTRVAAPPAELARVPTDSVGWLNRRVIVRGTFDHAHSIILPGRAYQGAPGAHVLTPIILTDGEAVLADRGWVPAADGATVQIEALPAADAAADTALVLPFPGQERRLGRAAPNRTSNANGEFKRVWFAMDERALRAQFPYALGAVHVQLLPSTHAPALPVRQSAPELSDGPHLGYALQWFSFAAIAVTGWLLIALRSRRASRQPRLHRD